MNFFYISIFWMKTYVEGDGVTFLTARYWCKRKKKNSIF